MLRCWSLANVLLPTDVQALLTFREKHTHLLTNQSEGLHILDRSWLGPDLLGISLVPHPTRTSLSLPSHKPESLSQACWKRARCPGSFQKFLGYTLLSVACFLHPVLVWHVTIPGSMLVLTALAYFLLSKRRKSPGHKETHPQGGQYVDPSATEAAPTIIGDTEQTYTFHEAQREQHRSLLGHMKSILKGSKDRSSAPETPVQPAAVPVPRKQVHFQEKVVQIIPSVSESLEDVESEAEETTSDTTPILTPPDAPIIIAPLSSAGLF
ncbi:transmembrane protein 72 isoform X2 [Cyanistes caeruleus]|uniref:transmembrane protein 72 isoform X2 n=1 Tax=Cyanistes caeruleus TaxID=156563 RepID=UPI000CDA45CF|nr:transmembrane protein 72 isoform X2 [Cyanistes caeruleus]